MDEFTFSHYSYECNILQISPRNYSSEITKFEPDLLFVESTRGGKDKLWDRKVDRGPSQELIDLVDFL